MSDDNLYRSCTVLTPCAMSAVGSVWPRFLAGRTPWMKGLTYEEQVALLCFLGRYLDLHGKPKEAVECWKECQACISTPVATRTSAGAELAAHGVTTDDYRAIERKPLGLAD